MFVNRSFTGVIGLNNVGTNEDSEIDFWDGKAPRWTLGAVYILPLGMYVGKNLGSFLCSTDVTSYCDFGGLSLRDLLELIALPEANWNYSNTIVSWVRIVLDMIIFSVGYFLLGVNEWIDMGYFIGSFDSTRNDMGVTFLVLTVEWIKFDSDIFVKNSNDSPPLTRTAEM